MTAREGGLDFVALGLVAGGTGVHGEKALIWRYMNDVGVASSKSLFVDMFACESVHGFLWFLSRP